MSVRVESSFQLKVSFNRAECKRYCFCFHESNEKPSAHHSSESWNPDFLTIRVLETLESLLLPV